MIELHIPKNVWIEWHDIHEPDARDVIVEMEDGSMFTALYVTIAYLQRQMELNFQVSKQLQDTPPVYHAALETAHIIINTLDRDNIEDSIDNLLALDTFESVFTRVTEPEEDTQPFVPVTGKRATQEVASVVINEVLLVETPEHATVA
jgi:hypothetical protein